RLQRDEDPGIQNREPLAAIAHAWEAAGKAARRDVEYVAEELALYLTSAQLPQCFSSGFYEAHLPFEVSGGAAEAAGTTAGARRAAAGPPKSSFARACSQSSAARRPPRRMPQRAGSGRCGTGAPDGGGKRMFGGELLVERKPSGWRPRRVVERKRVLWGQGVRWGCALRELARRLRRRLRWLHRCTRSLSRCGTCRGFIPERIPNARIWSLTGCSRGFAGDRVEQGYLQCERRRMFGIGHICVDARREPDDGHVQRQSQTEGGLRTGERDAGHAWEGRFALPLRTSPRGHYCALSSFTTKLTNWTSSPERARTTMERGTG